MGDSKLKLMDVSFVIIGKNAEWSIARLLQSVTASTPPCLSKEIIYVDSASTDHTVEIVNRYPVRVVQLSTSQPLCASAGRFVGSQYAHGKYVVFLDSDMELMDGWLEQAVAVLDEEPDIGVISGFIVDICATGEIGRIVESPRRDQGPSEIKYAGNAAMFRQVALRAAGTWNPYIISDEEPELCLRIRRAGYRIVQLPIPISRHYTYPADKIATLLSRRRRRLFLGYGQVMRYHLRSGLLGTYLRERGWVLLPLLAGLVGATAVLASCVSGNVLWVAAFLCVIVLAFAMDVIRCRSLYRAVFHILHRALILEGAIRGFLLRPLPPQSYPIDAPPPRRLIFEKGSV